jgi:hypothetical protein
MLGLFILFSFFLVIAMSLNQAGFIKTFLLTFLLCIVIMLWDDTESGVNISVGLLFCFFLSYPVCWLISLEKNPFKRY